ncbi:hypothetical protein MTO96_035657 [Rhipicephalus appendiculatus]
MPALERKFQAMERDHEAATTTTEGEKFFLVQMDALDDPVPAVHHDWDKVNKASKATHYHVASTNERLNPALNLSGSGSRRNQNAAAAREERLPRHSYDFPQNVHDVLLKFYEQPST